MSLIYLATHLERDMSLPAAGKADQIDESRFEPYWWKRSPDAVSKG